MPDEVDCGCRRRDGRYVDDRRRRLEELWHSPEWRELSSRTTAAARTNGAGCVDCGSLSDLVADHIEAFDGRDDPLALDETNVAARCRSCSGKKDGGRRR